jgi:hypothetical protein
MSEIGNITVKIGADTYELQKGLTDAKVRVNDFDKSTTNLSNSLKSLALVGVATATAVGVFVKKSIDAMDALDEVSQKTGVAVQALSKLGYAANVEGVGMQGLQQAFVFLSRNMSEAAQGAGSAIPAFNALGIAFKNNDGTLRSSEQVFLDVAEKFAGMEDGAGKTALAMAIFGRAGAQLIPMLNQGRAGLEAYGAELEAFGGVITPKAAAEAAHFNDNLNRLQGALGAVGQSIAMELLPSLTRLSEEFLIAIKNGLSFGEMLRMGLRIGNTQEQLQKVREEIELVNKQWGLFNEPKEEQLESLRRQEKVLMDVIAKTDELNAKQNMVGPPVDAMGKQIAPQMADANAAATAEKQQQDLMAAQATRLETILQGNMAEIELEKAKYAELLNQLMISKEMFAVEEETYQQWELEAFNAHQQRLTDITRKEANARIAEQQRESQMVNAARMQTASLAVGLLQTLGQKSKAAALAAIVLNKGLMIAQTIMNTQAASMRAMAELGPIAGPPAAAAIEAMGAASVGIIGATGLLEAGAAMSGGGGGGFSGSSTGAASVANTVQNAENNAQGASGGGGQTVNIALQGNTFNRDQVRDLITQINEVISDGSTLRLS